MSSGYRPQRGGVFPEIPELMVRGRFGLLDPERLRTEIATQLEAFVGLFGTLPDFFDGHQHSHLFPQVRDALLDVVKQRAPSAWVRQCGRVATLSTPFWDYKTRMLNTLSRTFRTRAAQFGIATNPAFAGAYDFGSAREADFARLFPDFLTELPARSVVMVHPGFVDAELERLDPLTTQRARELAYLAGDQFPAAMAAEGLALA